MSSASDLGFAEVDGTKSNLARCCRLDRSALDMCILERCKETATHRLFIYGLPVYWHT